MNTTQVSKFRIAIYGVLVEDGRVLLTDTRVPSGVITNFPGGGLELGEPPLEALAREFREETCINVRVGELLFCSQLFQQNPEYPHEQLMHIYYRVYRHEGIVQLGGNNDDVVSAAWVALADLNKKRILDVDMEFITHRSFQACF
jgi:8-oxo-dGTP pyrophosphatase MutT (NUDIX family)